MTDIIEVIYYENNKINIKLIQENNINDKEYVKNIFIRFQKTIPKLICLDFHGVADLYNTTDKISNLPCCILSYIGRKKETRDNTREEIKLRILNGQIIFGFMVFKKLRNINNNTCYLGSKRTPIELLLKYNDISTIYFIDDQQINVDTVNSIQKTCIQCYLHKYYKNIKKLIRKIERNNIGGTIDYKYKYEKYIQKYIQINNIKKL